MSHTTTLGIKRDIEHIEFARQGYESLAASIRNDLAGTTATHTQLTLAALLEYAEAGANLAKKAKETILTSVAIESASH